MYEECITHDDKVIKGFFNEYKFLSNFWPCIIEYEGEFFPSVENAYQAAKVQKEYREELINCKPNASKRLWKKLPRIDKNPDDWDNRRYDIMFKLVEQKFAKTLLKEALLKTGNKYLEETNNWKDTFWGVDIKLGGKNVLGRILMDVRKNLQV